ncbi:baculoviral IAP repeat-containing protein 6-like [Patiria miniata]|uniref:Dual E2 ubiquitin-conjugating enzyme/E3 ubiquitin-protein ligase BIRC6 n=1 Tax=Patiria miniata TaxID=46514 RepID=A0A914BHA3_PATMI|nr:baculoviral IAP repeat-containing protein 6-like [Patiria miniata]
MAAMDMAEWSVVSDGSLYLGEETTALTYHPKLNTILAVTGGSNVRVVDVNSGVTLQNSTLSAQGSSRIHCQYLSDTDQVFMTDGRAVGLRKDLSGVLLLDSALQTAVSNNEETIVIELPYLEACHLLECLKKSIKPSSSQQEYVDEVQSRLETELSLVSSSIQTESYHKVTKWATIQLRVSLCALRSVCRSLLDELRRSSQHVNGLSIAAAIADRLQALYPEPSRSVGTQTVDRAQMYSEAARRETFLTWPHMNYKWALPEPMAQAGFYHQPSAAGDDRAMCFTCSVCLVCWEPTDEPWSEHERHSPNCPFVRGEPTENVPLSFTLATGPGQLHGDGSQKITCVSTSSCPHLMATSSRHGNISLWDVSNQLTLISNFQIDPEDPALTGKPRDAGEALARRPLPKIPEAWVEETSLTEIKGTAKEDENSANLSECGQGVTVENGEPDQDQATSSLHQEIAAKDKSYGTIEVIEVGGAWRNISELHCNADVDEAGVMPTPKGCPESSTNLIVSSVSILQGLPKEPSASSADLNTMDPLSTPCLVAAICIRKPDDADNAKTIPVEDCKDDPSPATTAAQGNPFTSAFEKMRITDDTGPEDEAGLGVDISNRTFEYADAYLGDEVDSKGIGKVSDSQHRKCLITYAAPPLVKNVAVHKKSTDKSKGGLFATQSGPSTLPKMYMSQILEMEEEQQALVEEPIGIEDLTADQSSSITLVDGMNVKPFRTSEAALQCIELPQCAQCDDLWVTCIAPCPDKKHVLVILGPHDGQLDNPEMVTKPQCNTSAKESICNEQNDLNKDSNFSTDEAGTGLGDDSAGCFNSSTRETTSDTVEGNFGFVLIYRIATRDGATVLQEDPVTVHTITSSKEIIRSLVPLPVALCDITSDEEGESTHQNPPSSEAPPNADTGSITAELAALSFDETDSKPQDKQLGTCAVLTRTGKFRIMEIHTWSTLATHPTPQKHPHPLGTERFSALTYCTGMERLCVCTESGRILFLQLQAKNAHGLFRRGKSVKKAMSEQEVAAEEETDAAEEKQIVDDYLANQPISMKNLSVLWQLTQFETLVPRFSATVPPCWVEIQQEQQQRRHPQHLHQRQQGDATQHTRTWKLQPDGSSWKEHLFELVLPKSCCVGHVDVKFNLHSSCPSAPRIYLTLLKQSGTQGKKEKDSMNIKSTPVDAKIDFNMEASSSEPKVQNIDVDMTEPSQAPGPEPDLFNGDALLHSAYLQSHLDDILCGPCYMECFIDMPSHNGMVTLTSRQLMLCKSRSFLLHIFAMETTESESSAKTKETGKEKGSHLISLLQNTPPASATERLVTALRKDTDKYRGCDWIQELSITIRRTKKVSLNRDRLQRVGMLESMQFQKSLVLSVMGLVPPPQDMTTWQHFQQVCLDVLCWVASVHICEPFRVVECTNLVGTALANIGDLVQACYISANRSIAHKCSQFLALCMGCAKRSPDPSTYLSFKLSLLQSLLSILPSLPSCVSSGSMHWFFSMMGMVKQQDPEITAQACHRLLMETASELADRTLPEHAVLRAKFGLFGTPLDPILFDMEPPVISPAPKTSSASSGASSTVPLTFPHHYNIPASGFSSDLPDIGGSAQGGAKLSSDPARSPLSGTHFMRGLLEVEPLHFVCCSTSDGTHVERVGSGAESVQGSVAINTGNPTMPESLTSSLSATMASAEQQLQLLQHKTQTLIKLNQQKQKLEQKLQETSASSTANSMPSNHMYGEFLPATPKNTPFFMTPPLTPPNESMGFLSVPPPPGGWDYGDMFGYGVFPGLEKGKGTPEKGKTKGDGSKLGPDVMPSNPLLVRNLLNPPPSHVLIVDRMHSGARRFAVLDFGQAVLLTDIFIPACSDLASLSVDVWTKSEELDGRRLAVALDINSRDLVMNDLLPPASCRFLKLTIVGRYGGNTVRSKIPLGVFYGHTYVFPFENGLQRAPDTGDDSVSAASRNHHLIQQEQFLTMALAVQEDIQCRYSLACSRLQRLLQAADLSPSAGGTPFPPQLKEERSETCKEVRQSYEECIQLQTQLNAVQRTITRLQHCEEGAPERQKPDLSSTSTIKEASTDQLRLLSEYLLDTLLSLTNTNTTLPASLQRVLQETACKSLFRNLCVMGTPSLRLRTGTLLVRVCSSQPWWGEFLASSLQEFFSSEQTAVFPQDRVFILLAYLGQKSLASNNSANVLESLLNLLARLMAPLLDGSMQAGTGGSLDLALIGWVLLFLSRTLDHTAAASTSTDDQDDVAGATAAPKAHGKDRERSSSSTSARWNFMASTPLVVVGPSAQASKGGCQVRVQSKLKQRLLLHKEQLAKLQNMHKAIQAKMAEGGKEADPAVQVHLKKKLQQHASKHLRDILRIRRITRSMRSRGAPNDPPAKPDKSSLRLPEVSLPRERCTPVVQGLMQLLLVMDFTCHADLFLFACKVLARVSNSTRPAISLSEIATNEQLIQLMMLCVGTDYNRGNSSWGGPWATTAITYLLQDTLEGEKLYPFSLDSLGAVGGQEEIDPGEDLDADAIPEDLEAVGGAMAGPGDDSGGDEEPMNPLGDPELAEYATGVPSDPFDHQFMMDMIWGSTKYEEMTNKFSGIQSMVPFGSSPGSVGSSGSIHRKGGRYAKVNNNAGDQNKAALNCMPNVSMAMDARLEQGLEMQVEWYLKVTSLMEAHSVSQTLMGTLPLPLTLPAPPPKPTDASKTESAPEGSGTLHRQVSMTSSKMLSSCFDQLFTRLPTNQVHLDAVLKLWLTVNEVGQENESKQEGAFDTSLVPVVTLSADSIGCLLHALAWNVNLPVHTWCLAFHCLLALVNSKTEVDGKQQSAANVILGHGSLIAVLVHFLSGSTMHGPVGSLHYQQVGPTVIQAMYEFLVRLKLRLGSVPAASAPDLNSLLLRVVQILAEPHMYRGAFHTGTGPLDAQVKMMEFVNEQTYNHADVSNITYTIDAISLLVHNHISLSSRAATTTSASSATNDSVSARSCFGGLFASMLRPGESRGAITGDASRDLLMCQLLQLVNQLVKIPLDQEAAARVQQGLPGRTLGFPAASPQQVDTSPRTDSKTLTSDSSKKQKSSSLSDDDKERSTEPSPPQPPESITPCIADAVLTAGDSIPLLLSSLSHCKSNKMASFLNLNSTSPLQQTPTDPITNMEPVSVGDNIFQILCTIASKVTSVDLMLRPLLTYLGGATGNSQDRGQPSCVLSEPLLWFILKVISSEAALQSFHEMGGVQLICRNLVASNRSFIDSSPSSISAIMQHLGASLRSSSSSSRWSKTNSSSSSATAAETESAEGLTNFAPFGAINSSSPTAQPAEVLLQPTAPHRRARSAAWSYHFYPEESWCDLTITLPSAILLKEVHIQPHLTSLATCPASVSLEISNALGSSPTPVSPPIPTTGLTNIKLHLPQAEVVTSVCLRLHRPLDSSTIGLSQIVLLGSAAFSGGGHSDGTGQSLPPLIPGEDHATKTSMRWLRLLHQCLIQSPVLESPIATTASRMPSLLTTCTSLLLSPHCQEHAVSIEAVLLKLGLCNTEVGLSLFDVVLRNIYGSEGDNGAPLMGRSADASTESTVDIIYQMGTTLDQGTRDRVQALLDWLGDTARVHLHKNSSFHRSPLTFSPTEVSLLNPASAHVMGVASILWASHEMRAPYDVGSLITKDLFSSLYEWSVVLPLGSPLKQATGYVLCAMCHVHPSYYVAMLSWMGIINPEEEGMELDEPLTDDSKDAQEHGQGLTDDSKGASRQSPSRPVHINMLDQLHLATLALASQSPQATRILLDSNFPNMLANALMDFCNYEIYRSRQGMEDSPAWQTDSYKLIEGQGLSSPRTYSTGSFDGTTVSVVHITSDKIAPILDLFTELSGQLVMKNWLGGPEGSVFWSSLLMLLCSVSSNVVQANTPPANARKSMVMTSQQRAAIESSTITFFTRVISCHPANQRLLAQVVCEVACSRSSQAGMRLAISGFTRRLILQLMLEDEKLLVYMQGACRLYKGRGKATNSGASHPQFGVGHKFRVMEPKMTATVGTLVTEVCDALSLVKNTSLPKDPKPRGERARKEEPFVLVDYLPGKKELLESEQYINYATHQGTKPKKPMTSSHMDKDLNPSSFSAFTSTPSSASVAFPLLPISSHALSKPPLATAGPAPSSRPPAKDPMQVPVVTLSHDLLPEVSLPDGLALGQLLAVLQSKGLPLGSPYLELRLNLGMQEIGATSKTDSSKSREAKEAATLNGSAASAPATATGIPGTVENGTHSDKSTLLDSTPVPSFLHVFASLGGLALIAEHLPIVYHDIPRQVVGTTARHSEKNGEGGMMAWHSSTPEHWGSASQGIVEEEDPAFSHSGIEPPPPSGLSNAAAPAAHGPVHTTAVIPPHSLAAFGLFLRLPGYAEVLLREQKKAQFLLRLVLGVTDDGDGGHILSSPVASSLPTLPFTVLVTLFDSTPLTTDDGVLLRRRTLEIGAVHLLLAFLAILSHHGPRVSSATTTQEWGTPNSNQGPAPPPSNDQKNQSYWAKGTGFGTGSTTSGWNVEQALNKQKAEEEHATCLLLVLSSFISPNPRRSGNSLTSQKDSSGDVSTEQLRSIFPEIFIELLSNSCLIPAISSYLRNDSVLDMARHVPLYCAVLEVLRALSQNPLLAPLLLPRDGDQSEMSLVALLENMKSCVDTYTSKLKLNKDPKPSHHIKHTGGPSTEEDLEAEGLTLLVPQIQHTVDIVRQGTSKLIAETMGEGLFGEGSRSMGRNFGQVSKLTFEERYTSVMKKLQFDTYPMVGDDDDGKIFLKVSHHYASNIKSYGNVSNASRARRLAQEAVTLSTSLPLSACSSVFVRCDEERLDVMKVLITGPSDTPYGNGCFEFDVYFPGDYPSSPMLVNLETTGQHGVRFNPNLYNDGKVCLSVLNTWHGRPEEKWNAQTSSFLQVLVSIQSLILVSEPYFNEPGYERSRGTPSGTQSSKEYDANIMQATVKWGMLEVLRNPAPSFKEVIHAHFFLKRAEIISQCEDWINGLELLCNDKRVGRTVAHHWVALKRHTARLREELAKLKPPTCVLEEFPDWDTEFQPEDPSNKPSTSTQGATAKTSPGQGAVPSTSSKMPSKPPTDDVKNSSELESIAKVSVDDDSIIKALGKASGSMIDTIVIEGESTSSASSSSILGDLSGGDEAGLY